MLKNKKIAWLISVLLIVFGLILGTFISFRQLRAEAEAAFTAQAVPILHEKIQMLYNMYTLYQLNSDDDAFANVLWDIELAQNAISSFGIVDTAALMEHSEALFNWSQTQYLNESDARYFNNFYIDMQETLMILGQLEYNVLASNFNLARSRGLGILIRPISRDVQVFN
jgi:uncharacterized protein YneF (UPF0154 family)